MCFFFLVFFLSLLAFSIPPFDKSELDCAFRAFVLRKFLCISFPSLGVRDCLWLVLVLLFVALWFILRGDLLYVFPCVILFLCFSALLALQLPCLGRRELILVLFVRLFDLCLFGFVGFLFLLGAWEGLRLVIVALPGLFLFPFFVIVALHGLFLLPFCLFVLRFYGPVNPMGSCRARSVYLTTRVLGRLSPLSGIVHSVSLETDNCPSWISGRERMTVENISWSISTKECCRSRRGLNSRPSGLQPDGASNSHRGQLYLFFCATRCTGVKQITCQNNLFFTNQVTWLSRFNFWERQVGTANRKSEQ